MMLVVFFRRFSRLTATSSIANPCLLSCFKCGYCSNVSPSTDKSDETKASENHTTSFTNHLRGSYPSSLFWHDYDQAQLDSRHIEVVDSDTWRVSAGLAHVSKVIDYESKSRPFGVEALGDRVVDNAKWRQDDPDIDEIEDMRIHGNLFYKIDPSSKEFEEYNFDFHRRKSSSNKNSKDSKSKQNPSCDHSALKDQTSMIGQKLINKNRTLNDNAFVNEERLTRTIKDKYIVCNPDSWCVGKKQRNPTFNQLTGPYHEPFCLDIYVSKGSIRACVVHRATSKVVAVAHSISKDIKFDVGSTKSSTAAAAVGKVLAQRALADDIHNVIFMPRKGDKLEGKLQIVLQAILDNGVNVKVKLKQRNPTNKAVEKPSLK